jgi:hypothetical protein
VCCVCVTAFSLRVVVPPISPPSTILFPSWKEKEEEQQNEEGTRSYTEPDKIKRRLKEEVGEEEEEEEESCRLCRKLHVGLHVLWMCGGSIAGAFGSRPTHRGPPPIYTPVDLSLLLFLFLLLLFLSPSTGQRLFP